MRLFSKDGERAVTNSAIEELATRLVDNGVGPGNKGTVVIRSGEKGCLVKSGSIPTTWMPPFYANHMLDSTDLSVSKLVDPTGAGNAFLGGYAVGYLRAGDALRAACFGAVAASVALEQIGMPERSKISDIELWNGVSVEARLQRYMSRGDVGSSTNGEISDTANLVE